MMGLELINQLSEKAAMEARKNNRLPVIYLGEESGLEFCRRIPNIGDYRPRFFKLVAAYMVDKTGMGDDSEPALTITTFCKRVEEKRPIYYAIIEEGQFQIVIGEFVKK